MVADSERSSGSCNLVHRRCRDVRAGGNTVNPIFVFGSNLAGRHMGGAARHALDHCGAIMGQADGLQGQSYAIPTVDDHFQPLPPSEIGVFVDAFLRFAADNPELSFLVTAIGCGIAGHDARDIAPLFAGASENVFLSEKLVAALRPKGV